MAEKPELIALCPTLQPWHPFAEVDWISRSEPHLKEAGLMAVGFWNGAVFLASADQKIEAGDKVRITQVNFRCPGREGTHTTHIVSRIE